MYKNVSATQFRAPRSVSSKGSKRRSLTEFCFDSQQLTFNCNKRINNAKKISKVVVSLELLMCLCCSGFCRIRPSESKVSICRVESHNLLSLNPEMIWRRLTKMSKVNNSVMTKEVAVEKSFYQMPKTFFLLLKSVSNVSSTHELLVSISFSSLFLFSSRVGFPLLHIRKVQSTLRHLLATITTSCWAGKYNFHVHASSMRS